MVDTAVYEGHLRQMAEPGRTATGGRSHLSYVAAGMYYKEFLPHADWMHISAAMLVFTKMGLSDPNGPQLRPDPSLRGFLHRARSRCAELRPAPQDHPQHVQREPRPADAADQRRRLGRGPDGYGTGHGEDNYEEFLFHFKDYHDTLGDVPVNLLSTGLALNAYMLAGEPR